ncbi:DsrE family protein [Gluconobacter frateurii]|uniref:Peroxiredoxin n=1 Tax=Gluconobacter frateurii NRIC 0228 TaxID=1307946 RepID=A0ABQ0QEM9_9PROT|nr:DsrE family protein [Gluconobacter frateurii]UMM08321.1 DsrE family protein [Gluconobacter frateurii]GBR15980.1 hypothetical protein AA0228_2655 [Gluconobacter frateurii NRIC 0228]GLP90451.1 hypothetical protein GCM10007868_15260 [Gluconobacter frateurii]
MTMSLFITLADDSWQRAHYALIVAAGALSLGRTVTIFAGGKSVHALAKDWSGLKDIIPDAELDSRGVASFRDLRDAVIDLGAHLMVCETGLALTDLTPDTLCETVSVRGIVTFLEQAGDRPILAL